MLCFILSIADDVILFYLLEQLAEKERRLSYNHHFAKIGYWLSMLFIE